MNEKRGGRDKQPPRIFLDFGWMVFLKIVLFLNIVLYSEFCSFLKLVLFLNFIFF